ncbi:MAG TPA: 3D domain-containing protein [Rhodocyclaceae bacterium]
MDRLLTCYTIADETSAPALPVRQDVCGLPAENSYRTAFLKDVKMQGSGTASDGSIVHYAGNQCYEVLTCAVTASGACATVGTTIAVDMTIIPRRSNVSVAILGARSAQDKGGMIKGYHIDEYLGPQPALCKQLGRSRKSAISLDSY